MQVFGALNKEEKYIIQEQYDYFIAEAASQIYAETDKWDSDDWMIFEEMVQEVLEG